MPELFEHLFAELREVLQVPSLPARGDVLTPKLIRTGFDLAMTGNGTGFSGSAEGLANRDVLQSGNGHNITRVGGRDLECRSPSSIEITGTFCSWLPSLVILVRGCPAVTRPANTRPMVPVRVIVQRGNENLERRIQVHFWTGTPLAGWCQRGL